MAPFILMESSLVVSGLSMCLVARSQRSWLKKVQRPAIEKWSSGHYLVINLSKVKSREEQCFGKCTDFSALASQKEKGELQ
jgi:hypothetical protein